MDAKSVHIWGFFDADGNRKPPTNVSVFTMRPYEVWSQMVSNINYFNDDTSNPKVTRTLDGNFIGIEFESIAGPGRNTSRMWHVITTASEDAWPAKNDKPVTTIPESINPEEPESPTDTHMGCQSAFDKMKSRAEFAEARLNASVAIISKLAGLMDRVGGHKVYPDLGGKTLGGAVRNMLHDINLNT